MYAKNEIGRKTDQKPFRYVLADCLHLKKSNNNVTANGVPKENKNKFDEYKEALRDFKTGQIMKLGKAIRVLVTNYLK